MLPVIDKIALPFMIHGYKVKPRGAFAVSFGTNLDAFLQDHFLQGQGKGIVAQTGDVAHTGAQSGRGHRCIERVAAKTAIKDTCLF